MRVHSQHHCDWLAGVTHFVQCEYRLIVKCRAVVRLGNHLADIFAGVDREHAGHCTRSSNIDTANTTVRHCAAKHFGNQHARHAEVMHVCCVARDFGVRFQTRYGATYGCDG